MLSDAEITKIEEMLFNAGMDTPDIQDLIATVKEQRELLRKQSEYTRHAPICRSTGTGMLSCDCGFASLQNQIEEKVK